MENFYIVLENIRSLHNVGAIMRSCSFFGLKNAILAGYSGTTSDFKGGRVIHPKIAKTSLGAQNDLNVQLLDSTDALLDFAKKGDFELVAVEQAENSIFLPEYVQQVAPAKKTKKHLLVFGNEVEGVSKQILQKADKILEIERKGEKHSLNVSTAVGVVLYALSTF